MRYAKAEKIPPVLYLLVERCFTVIRKMPFRAAGSKIRVALIIIRPSCVRCRKKRAKSGQAKRITKTASVHRIPFKCPICRFPLRNLRKVWTTTIHRQQKGFHLR